MFGIKTRKDKQIEELKETNKCLQERLARTYFKHPQIITTHGNVISLGAGQELEEGMSVDYAKRMIAEKLVNSAMDFIHYDLEGHEGKMIFKGYIQIVTYGK